jgi:wyosine [tRNA(Phe)-imidazoG37] synthetase (radical SAM superfamily)
VRRLVYGPVPSRRLGRSLGVDLVPFKTCSYDCMYCWLGRGGVPVRRCSGVDSEAALVKLMARSDL